MPAPNQQVVPTQAHINKIGALRQQTYALITNPLRMPEWRQLKWSQFLLYADEYKKAKGKMLPFQKSIVETMLNPGETIEDGIRRAHAGLNWLGSCTLEHDRAEKVILTLPENQLNMFDITKVKYPSWPL